MWVGGMVGARERQDVRSGKDVRPNTSGRWGTSARFADDICISSTYSDRSRLSATRLSALTGGRELKHRQPGGAAERAKSKTYLVDMTAMTYPKGRAPKNMTQTVKTPLLGQPP